MFRRFVLVLILGASLVSLGCDGDKNPPTAGAGSPPPKREAPGQKAK
ncbi:hypothetical protein R5W24_001345 [Gemmata sp. JC717]|uniref:Uncharacterized protein n=1 Tax=Gemmata algarum TaxID=2975278 RepID=A0ABU5EU13_9BACT|nr:hypothetical protein [Gemmata algarum]MDY3552265.1 hypothetical protein [Gemmata algarum]MDY3558802.1 hypothetical protein [Gemmata algarum]